MKKRNFYKGRGKQINRKVNVTDHDTSIDGMSEFRGVQINLNKFSPIQCVVNNLFMYNCLSLIAYGCVYNFVNVSDCLCESAAKMIQNDPK